MLADKTLHLAQFIVITLEDSGAIGYYKTLDANMKDCLLSGSRQHLIRIEIENNLHYYVTHGAVFDKDFNPVMMMSWTIEKIQSINAGEEDSYTYTLIRPIIRFSPSCFNKADSMQRYLVNKLLVKSLNKNIKLAYWGRDIISFFPQCDRQRREGFTLKIEIDECPFSVREIEAPSISTTNESLIQLALDHIDEVAA